ncbi:unnamed protein product [Closterium sp. NIES-54]
MPVTPVLSPSASRARLSHALAPAAPASRRPCCPVPSRRPCCPVAPAVPSPLLSRPIAPAVPSRPVAPAVPPRRPLLSILVPSSLLFPRERADVTAWKSRDAAACIALRSLLPEYEETHFTQVRTTSEFLTAIKAHYATPTTISLGHLFLPFLFLDLASFERTADLITHLRSLDSSYRATCTDAQLALLPPPMVITIYLIATSLPDRLASVCDALLLKHPSELTIEVLESALKDVESNLRSVASASGVVPPPLFHGCTVPQLPTFTASLVTAASDLTAAALTTSSQSRGRSGKRGGQGAGGGGGGDMVSGGGGSAGAGGAPHVAAVDSPAAAGGGDARVRQPPTGPPAAGGGAAACSSCEAEIYAGAMAAQELRWLTYLLTDLGEQPRSPPVLYIDNKAMLALCREHRLEHRTKHIALRYFLARELQQRGQLRLAYVASEANTANIFTKALAPGDHQRFCTLLDCVVFLFVLNILLVHSFLFLHSAVSSTLPAHITL